MAKTFSTLGVGSTIYLRNYQNYKIKNGMFKGQTVEIKCEYNHANWLLTATITHIEEHGDELIISYKTHKMNHTVRVHKTSTVGRFYKHSGLQQFEYYVLTELD